MIKQRLVVGISGSSGAILGIRLLAALQPTPIETHLILTPSARLTIQQETNWKVEDVLALADKQYDPANLAAPVASGSFDTMGMVVIPCSIKSLSAIANSYSGDLLTRAADVTLKEGRPLLLVVREAPLHAGHIRLMSQAAENGAVIFPPVPAFYNYPQTVDKMVDNIVGRVLRRVGITNDLYQAWLGSVQQTGEQPQTGEVDVWSPPVMTLATTGSDGILHAAAIYFAADQERHNLYFFSTADSQISLDLAANPNAAAEIHLPMENGQEFQGLRLLGEVRPVPRGEEWERGWACYLVKFPFASAQRENAAHNILYTFHPSEVRRTNYRSGFGQMEEWTPE